MLTLYHGPNTRSSRIVQLLIEMDVLDKVDIRVVGLRTHIPKARCRCWTMTAP